MRAKEKKEINVETGRNIKFYREKAGYSREKLAELAGVSPRFIADVESGVVGVSLTTLKNVCQALGISADRILWNDTDQCPGLDEKVSHLEQKYVDAISEIVQKQIELISEITMDKREG